MKKEKRAASAVSREYIMRIDIRHLFRGDDDDICHAMPILHFISWYLLLRGAAKLYMRGPGIIYILLRAI